MLYCRAAAPATNGSTYLDYCQLSEALYRPQRQQLYRTAGRRAQQPPEQQLLHRQGRRV